MASVFRYLSPLALVVVGVINLIPLSGVFGADRINSLYGISIDDPDLSILLRHRAVLFGLLGVLCIYAAVKPSLQLIALIAGGVSVVSYLFLASSTGGYNDALGRVFLADIIAAVLLAIGFVGYLFTRLNRAG